MKTIIVLTDFSYTSFNAARYAMLFARVMGQCRVLVYHACPPQPQFGDRFNPVKEDRSPVIEACKDRLQDIEVSLEPFRGDNVILESHTDEMPLPDGCADLATRTSADLVIIGSHGRSMTRNRLFGSHTLTLVNELPFPLLIVPPDFIFEPLGLTLFAYQLKDIDRIPVDKIAWVAGVLGSRLAAVNAGTTDMPYKSLEMLRFQENLERLLEPLDPEYYFIHNHRIDDALVKFASRQQAGLLIVIHKEHSFLHRLLHDSTSLKLAELCKLPILVLKELPA